MGAHTVTILASQFYSLDKVLCKVRAVVLNGHSKQLGAVTFQVINAYSLAPRLSSSWIFVCLMSNGDI